jgi:hypothetical protein
MIAHGSVSPLPLQVPLFWLLFLGGGEGYLVVQTVVGLATALHDMFASGP